MDTRLAFYLQFLFYTDFFHLGVGNNGMGDYAGCPNGTWLTKENKKIPGDVYFMYSIYLFVLYDIIRTDDGPAWLNIDYWCDDRLDVEHVIKTLVQVIRDLLDLHFLNHKILLNLVNPHIQSADVHFRIF